MRLGALHTFERVPAADALNARGNATAAAGTTLCAKSVRLPAAGEKSTRRGWGNAKDVGQDVGIDGVVAAGFVEGQEAPVVGRQESVQRLVALLGSGQRIEVLPGVEVGPRPLVGHVRRSLRRLENEIRRELANGDREIRRTSRETSTSTPVRFRWRKPCSVLLRLDPSSSILRFFEGRSGGSKVSTGASGGSGAGLASLAFRRVALRLAVGVGIAPPPDSPSLTSTALRLPAGTGGGDCWVETGQEEIKVGVENKKGGSYLALRQYHNHVFRGGGLGRLPRSRRLASGRRRTTTAR